MTESNKIEINITRLLLAAIKTYGEINVSLEEYLSEDLNEYRIYLEPDDNEKNMKLKLFKNLEEVQNESGSDGETSTPDSQE